MFLSCNGSAKTAETLVALRKAKEAKIKAKLAAASARWNKEDSSLRELEDGSTADLSQSERSASLVEIPKPTKGAAATSSGNNTKSQSHSSAWDEDKFEKRISADDLRQVHAIEFVEKALEKHETNLQAYPDHRSRSEEMLKARVSSGGTLAAMLAINQYKKIIVDETNTLRIVEELTTLLQEITTGNLVKIRDYKDAVQAIVEQPAATTNNKGNVSSDLSKVTPEMVMEELQKLILEGVVESPKA